MSRNLEIVFWENMPGRVLWRAVWDHILFTLLHATGTALRRHPVAYLNGKMAFLGNAANSWRHRRQRKGGHNVDHWIEPKWLNRVMKYRSGSP